MNYFEYMAEYISSGGGRDTIDFDAHGVNIANLVLSGGGTLSEEGPEAQGLFTEIVEKQPKYALRSANGNQFRCTIATQAGPMLGMFLVAAMGRTMMTAKIIVMPIMGASIGDYTGITVIAEVM
jgi:hypothetical protein